MNTGLQTQLETLEQRLQTAEMKFRIATRRALIRGGLFFLAFIALFCLILRTPSLGQSGGIQQLINILFQRVQGFENKDKEHDNRLAALEARNLELEARVQALEAKLNNLQLLPGPKGDKGDPGPQGPQGPGS